MVLQILVDDRLKKSGVVYESIGFYYLRQDSLVVYQRQRCKTMRITNLYLTSAGQAENWTDVKIVRADLPDEANTSLLVCTY